MFEQCSRILREFEEHATFPSSLLKTQTALRHHRVPDKSCSKEARSASKLVSSTSSHFRDYRIFFNKCLPTPTKPRHPTIPVWGNTEQVASLGPFRLLTLWRDSAEPGHVSLRKLPCDVAQLEDVFCFMAISLPVLARTLCSHSMATFPKPLCE